ncbi:biotin carboxyl carrier protein [Scopulibacillus darangshiensis]|uniref:Biotin carboxyl carrier protein of acetyl-CoA carboxylase n=1 Tax=Scopulibacillus darangshiensis TaxID=442528 RepID=A0A4R2NPP0_9BACL|nr:acetyl-CoA carboxylase biotin carboxyl carrier protein [Scopulibacillus darangshiensis]TCP23740.1 biotin carboxyl carrier protein [Scopulibacillus darangshiensis]
MINVRELEEVIDLMNRSSVQKIHIEHEGTTVIIDKAEATAVPPKREQAEQHHVQTRAVENSYEEKEDQVDGDTQQHQVLSPMVGTFYSRPEEDADPFVQVGSKIKSNDTVGIIEAMKLFNDVEAGVDGEVTEVLVDDGQVVEFGQPLFVVK